MASSTSKTKPAKKTQSVETYLTRLDSVLKPEVLAIRQIILEIDPSITEQIKWNVPSFCTSEHFATFNLRAKDSTGIILHLGAKVRDTAITGINISDPESLLEWLGADRAMIKFYDLNDVESKKLAFVNIIQQWIQYV
jgi:hypothetical protein